MTTDSAKEKQGAKFRVGQVVVNKGDHFKLPRRITGISSGRYDLTPADAEMPFNYLYAESELRPLTKRECGIRREP